MYSWTIGLGADFVSLFAYYLASPLNWFLLLCPKGYVIEFMSILMILRVSLCGLTFAYYLKNIFTQITRQSRCLEQHMRCLRLWLHMHGM